MFDIHQPVFDQDGEYDDDRVGAYIDGLMAAFNASPEAGPVRDAHGDLGWAGAMAEYAISYLGTTPPEMTPADFDEVVFDLFPRKVSVEPEAAGPIVAELRAFWGFLAREYGSANAPKILAALDGHAADRLRARLADPSLFGMAKSFFTLGAGAGFDMTTPEGVAAFQNEYNRRLADDPRRLPLGVPPAGPGHVPPLPPHERPSGKDLKQKRKERKRQRDAKKRNRR